MAICLVCPYCKHSVPMPDGEAKWKEYGDTGMAIRTVIERIVAQPVIRRYETPQPVLVAISIGIPLVAIGSSFAMYFKVDPMLTALVETAAMGALFFWASSRIEMTELNDDDPALTDEPEDEPVQPLEQVTRTRNTMSIRTLYTPPDGDNPQSTQRLAKATLGLARLATGVNPIEPVSFDNAKSAGWKFGERTFTTVQSDWRRKGLAFLDQRGWCYLTAAGNRILALFADPHSPTQGASR